MICFALCVGGDGEKFRQIAEPALRETMAPEDRLWTTQGATGICSAYNDFLDRAKAEPDCEALVLLHDDVELLDPQFRAKVLAAVAEPDVAVVGVIGGSGLWNAAWWESRRWAGEAMYTPEVVGNFAHRHADVDTVDGFLMVLSPRAVAELRFDGETLPAWHGYDVDLCLGARRRGLRVVVRPLEVFHRTKATLGDSTAFYEAKKRLVAKYPDLIRRRSAIEWTRDTHERVERRIRRLRRERAYQREGLEAPHEAPQTYRRAGVAAPPIDNARILALWLHEFVEDDLVLCVGSNEDLLRALTEEGIVAQATQTSDADLGISAWKTDNPGIHPQAITFFYVPWSGADVTGELAKAVGILPHGGRVLLEYNLIDHADDPLAETGMVEDDLRESLESAGLEIERFTVMSNSLYRPREEVRERRRQSMLTNQPWPPRDLIRAVGRKPE